MLNKPDNAMDREQWLKANHPDYSNNVNLKYPYTESEYKTFGVRGLKGILGHQIPLIDFWGEGRRAEDISTGFSDAYNVNHQYQCVGTSKYRIPNRIPTKDYDNLDIRQYVETGSTLCVTTMGSPVTESCAKEITRILDPKNGTVIFYGVESYCRFDLERLKAGLKEKQYCLISFWESIGLEQKYLNIPREAGLTAFTFKNAGFIKQFAVKNFGKNPSLAAAAIKDLLEAGQSGLVLQVFTALSGQTVDTMVNVIEKLYTAVINTIHEKYLPKFFVLLSGESRLVAFAHKINNKSGAMFDRMFKNTPVYNIFRHNFVTLTNKKFNMPLKLPKKMADADDDKPAYGGKAERGTENNDKRYFWYFLPEGVYNDMVYFSLWNEYFDMPLKLPKKMLDKDNDKPAYGGSPNRGIEGGENRSRFLWTLSLKYSGGLWYFSIKNLAFGMPLKLPVKMLDRDNDKPAYGGSSSRGIEGGENEDRFYWKIS